MLHLERWKIFLIIFVSLMGAAYAVPNLLPQEKKEWLQANVSPWLPSKTINLGLDLRGGSHLLLEADMKTVMTDRFTSMAQDLRKEFREKEIRYENLEPAEGGVTVRLINPEKDSEEAQRVARKVEKRATVTLANGVLSVVMDESAVAELQKQIIDQSIEIVRRRVDESGTKEPIIARQGANRIVLQMPGLDDPTEVKEKLNKTAVLSFHLLDEAADPTSITTNLGSMRLPIKGGGSLVIKKEALIKGDMLTNAQPQLDQMNQVAVSFTLTSLGSQRFCEISRANIGRKFAIVLDKEVISYPYFREPICGGSGQISGDYTMKEATDFALLLRAGALPTSLTVVEERNVGPSLGSDSVQGGKMAAIVALAAVMLLMFASYGLFGLFADIALLFNLAFIFALLSTLQATLTLPGIAGIILTIGIAVDANVLIYERIREEIRHGRTVMSAIDTGFQQALRTIIDSNLTTLIVAFILFSFGSGPVKGFAVAMSIGIVTSLYSSIMLTRLIIILWLKKAQPKTLVL
jgi:preprotein translocase subunit SecD